MNAISPTQSNAQASLRAFLLAILPGDPSAAPAIFVGTISGTTLTVSKIISGSILANAQILGAASGTIIVGPGGPPNTYVVSPSQTVSNPTTMATGVSVVAGQQNRVPESTNPWFAVMTPIRFRRLATNVDQSEDCKFTGSVTGTTLTVTDVGIGTIETGANIFGTGVTIPTTIIEQLTGSPPGGSGTYEVTPSQTVLAGTLSSGQKTMTQSAEIVIQLDFHSPDTTAGDFAQTVSTALRDEFGVSFFANLSPPLNGVVPFYADDPTQRPFINDANQYEFRWSLDARFEIDQIVTVPGQYADAASIAVKDVSALYPP